jgi:four helix bundle protein
LLAVSVMAGVRPYDELDCWKLADELKNGVYALIDRCAARKDFDFRDQLRSSASSATSNISEAFGYYRHPEAARHARIAKASLTETHNHLGDGVDRSFWTLEDVKPLQVLARRAIGATIGWICYLESSETPKPYWRDERVPPTRKTPKAG